LHNRFHDRSTTANTRGDACSIENTQKQKGRQMYSEIKGEYGTSLVWVEKEEPVRPDPKLDRLKLSELLLERKWIVADLEYAIAAYQFPKPIARAITAHGAADDGEPIYSRRQIARWHERLVADLERLGITAKGKLR
jgi:hypothetical protein